MCREVGFWQEHNNTPLASMHYFNRFIKEEKNVNCWVGLPVILCAGLRNTQKMRETELLKVEA